MRPHHDRRTRRSHDPATRRGRSATAALLALGLAGLLGVTPLSAPAAEAAEESEKAPACPGGGYSPELPCLGKVFVRNADGEILDDVSLESFHIDPDARRLIAHIRNPDDAVVEWGIDTPSGVPTQIGGLREIPVEATDGDGDRISQNLTNQVSTYDPASRTFFVGAAPAEGGRGCAQDDGTCLDDAWRIVAMELDSDRHVVEELPGRDLPDEAGYEDHQPRAFAYDAEHRVLYVLSSFKVLFPSVTSSAVARTALHAYRYDAGGESPTFEHRWSYDLDGCNDIKPDGNGALGLASTGDFLYMPCRGQNNFNAPVQPRLHSVVLVDFGLDPGDDPGELSSTDAGERFEVSSFPFAGNIQNAAATVDPVNDRLFIMVAGAGAKRAYVFDARHRAWTGSRTLLDAAIGGVAVNTETGRGYVTDGGHNNNGNLYLVDAGQVPAAQGPTLDLGDGVTAKGKVRSHVDPVTRRYYLRSVSGGGVFRVYEDRTDPFTPTTGGDPDDATHDIDESEAVSVTHTGEASAYGTRFTSLSDNTGKEVWRTAAVERTSLGGDRTGSRASAVARGLVPSERANQAARDLGIDGGVPRAHHTIDGALGLGAATFNDTANESLLEGLSPLFEEMQDRRRQFREGNPDDSCDARGEQFDDGYHELFGRDPANPGEAPEPEDDDDECGPHEDNPDSADNRYDDAAPGKERQRSRCADPGGPQTASEPGSAAVCDGAGHELEAAAWMPHDTEWRPDDPAGSPFRVGSSASRVHTERLDDGGLAVESHAVASGIEIGAPGAGGIHIGEVRSVARSEAHGRPGTADSTHTVSIDQVRIVDPNGDTAFACGWDTDAVNTDEAGDGDSQDDESTRTQACDPGAVMDALDDAAQFYTVPVRFELAPREQDPDVVGSDGGARASVTKDRFRRANDIAMTSDSSHEVPALRVTVFNEYSTQRATQNPTREILDLAAVRTEALYQIGAPPQTGGEFDPGPSSLEVELADGSGSPLAGGHFEVRSPDGAPIRGGACTTAADGVGDCEFEPIDPGSYTVVQTAAPEGYVASSQPANVTVPVGGDTNVRFVNLAAIGTVGVTLVDASTGGPLAGGAFALHADDGDQTLGPADQQVASCTTGSDGSCGFGEVPLGAYVLHQAEAPQGYEPAGDLAFSLTRPGQDAGVRIVNGREAEASVGGVQLASSTPQGPTTTLNAGGSGGEGPLQYLRQTVGDAARFLVRNPGQAVLFGLFWLLVGAPAYLALRRRDLQLAKEIT